MMVDKLKELLKYAYCPWSHFQVAAIAISEEGKEYPGVNVENAAFPSGLCAERSALFGSVAHGAKVGTFKEIHIISSSNEIISPWCRMQTSVIWIYGRWFANLPI